MVALIVTPLPEEHQSLDTALRDAGLCAVPDRCGPIDITRYPDAGFVTARGGHGKSQFGVQTRYLLDTLPAVAHVICAGAAGALDRSLRIGDIVLGETTIEHDYTLRFVTRPLPAFPGDPVLLDRYGAVARRAGLRFQEGTIASGDEDIVDSARGGELAELTGAIAVAWEGSGAARACSLTQMPWLEIRAITDTADHTAAADFDTNLGVAMASIATLLAKSTPDAG